MTAELVQDAEIQGAWRVEKIVDDRTIEITIFCGPDAKERADKYATWRYGSVIESAVKQA